jgi:hypothetical protein
MHQRLLSHDRSCLSFHISDLNVESAWHGRVAWARSIIRERPGK